MVENVKERQDTANMDITDANLNLDDESPEPLHKHFFRILTRVLFLAIWPILIMIPFLAIGPRRRYIIHYGIQFGFLACFLVSLAALKWIHHPNKWTRRITYICIAVSSSGTFAFLDYHLERSGSDTMAYIAVLVGLVNSWLQIFLYCLGCLQRRISVLSMDAWIVFEIGFTLLQVILIAILIGPDYQIEHEKGFFWIIYIYSLTTTVAVQILLVYLLITYIPYVLLEDIWACSIWTYSIITLMQIVFALTIFWTRKISCTDVNKFDCFI